MNLYIDYGGTSFRYFLKKELITISSSTVSLIDFLDDMCKKYKNIKSISISFAGQVQNGIIKNAPNISIKEFDIKKYIEKKYNISLKIDNDLNCAAIAEYKKYKNNYMALFYIGTGFGSAYIDNGKLIRGYRNQSGEIGHIPFVKTPFVCGCGRDDCIELSCSGSAIIKWCEYFNIEKEFQRVDKLAKLDTPESRLILDNFYKALAYAFHTSNALFDFSLIVLGGSVGKNKEIKKFLKKQIQNTAFNKKDISIKISTLENGSLEGTKFL